MLSYWAEFGLFIGESLIIVISIVAVIIVIGAVSQKSKPDEQGRLTVKHLNDMFRDVKNTVRLAVMEKADYKKLVKQEHQDKKQKVKAARCKKDKEDSNEKKCLYVVDFHGDIKASAATGLSAEISAILAVARENDEVLIRLESQGGLVHSYGFATAELERLIDRNIRVTVSVDKVAASGGYMMASVAHHIIAAPFAVIGSIGVVAQLPNVHRLLKKNNIDIEQHTAGEYKRTLTILGENTDKGRTKFLEDLEKTHQLFKRHIAKYRSTVNLEEVATGEIWYGQEAVDKKLVDRIGTSADYIFSAINEGTETYQIKWEVKKKGLVQKLTKGVESTSVRVIDTLWEKITTARFFP